MDGKEKIKKVSSIDTFDVLRSVFAFIVAFIIFIFFSEIKELLRIQIDQKAAPLVASLFGMIVYLIPGKKRTASQVPNIKHAVSSKSNAKYYADNIALRLGSEKMSYIFLELFTIPILIIFPLYLIYTYYSGGISLSLSPKGRETDLYLGYTLLLLSWIPILCFSRVLATTQEKAFFDLNIGAAQLEFNDNGLSIFCGVLADKKLRNHLACNKRFILTLPWQDISKIQIANSYRTGAAFIPAYYKINLAENSKFNKYAKMAANRQIRITRGLFSANDQEIINNFSNFAKCPIEKT